MVAMALSSCVWPWKLPTVRFGVPFPFEAVLQEGGQLRLIGVSEGLQSSRPRCRAVLITTGRGLVTHVALGEALVDVFASHW